MDYANSFNAVRLILAKFIGKPLRIGAVAPVAWNEHDIELKTLGKPLPKACEMAGFAHQDFVARAQSVYKCRLPSTGTRGWVNDDWLLRLENASNAFEDRFSECLKFGSSMVNRGVVHSPENSVGNIGRTRNLQKVTTAWMTVERKAFGEFHMYVHDEATISRL